MQHSVAVLVLTFKIDAAAADVDKYRGLAQCCDCINQLSLHRGQLEIYAVTALCGVVSVTLFALNGGIDTHHQHHNVCLACGNECLVARVLAVLVLHGLGYVAAAGVDHAAVKAVLNAAQKRGISCRRTVVVTKQYALLVCVGTDDGNGAYTLIQRQNTVVFEQYHALLRHFAIERAVFVAIHNVVGDVIVFAVVVKHTKAIACLKQLFHGSCDHFLGYKSLVVGIFEPLICAAAVELAAVINGKRSTFRVGVCHLVVAVDITDCTAIGNDVAVKSPFTVQNILKQRFACTAGLAVEAVVSAHDGRGISVVDAVLKCP